MSEIENDILSSMYEQCLTVFGKRKEKSLWMLVITCNSNTVKRAINESTYDASYNSPIMKKLEEKRYVQEINPGKYSLTAEGILFTEKVILNINDDELLDWVNKKMLISNNSTITDKNRVILLTLLACRNFSENNSASYAEPDKEKTLLTLLSKSSSFLSKHGIISQSILDENDQGGSKTSASKFLGQIDKLPASSGLIFTARNGKYYLDVIKNGRVDRQSITLLTKIILGDKINYDLVTDLTQFCYSTYMDYGYVFKSSVDEFEGPIVEFDIKTGINNALL